MGINRDSLCDVLYEVWKRELYIPMKKTKLKLTLIALAMLGVLAIAFVLKNQFEPGLWTFWFIAFNGVLGIYAGANVTQKGVLKNEHPKIQS